MDGPCARTAYATGSMMTSTYARQTAVPSLPGTHEGSFRVGTFRIVGLILSIGGVRRTCGL